MKHLVENLHGFFVNQLRCGDDLRENLNLNL
jgi:hypothetical protein